MVAMRTSTSGAAFACSSIRTPKKGVLKRATWDGSFVPSGERLQYEMLVRDLCV